MTDDSVFSHGLYHFNCFFVFCFLVFYNNSTPMFKVSFLAKKLID